MARRSRAVVALLAVALLGYGGVLDQAAGRGPAGRLQAAVEAYLDRSERSAVEAFAAARTINAGISVLKSMDLSAVVAQVAPMQVLEPVDDLAKEFSDVMVVSIVAILVERLVLEVAQLWALTAILPLGCVLLAAASLAWRRPRIGRRLARLGRWVILVALFARFVVLAAGWVGDGVTQRFLAADLGRSMTVVGGAGGRLGQMTAKAGPPSAAGADSLLGRLRDDMTMTWQQAQAWVPDRAAVDAVLVGLPDQIVRAIEIFLVQTILTPGLVGVFLWMGLRGVLLEADGRDAAGTA
jgi:hypothetical protein